MIKISSYKLGDIFRVVPLHDNYIMTEGLDLGFVAGESYVFAVEQQILAIAGASILWPGVANLVVMLDKNFLEYRKACEIELALKLDIWRSSNSIRRMYTIIDSREKKHIKWAEHFGFQYEYTMIKAGPDGQDILGYVIL